MVWYGGRILSTVLDDFEDLNNVSDDYSGNTGNYSLETTNALNGTQSLQADAEFSRLAHSTITISRGNQYKVNVDPAGDGLWFMVGVQDTANILDDSYYVLMDVGSDSFKLEKRQNGSGSTLSNSSTGSIPDEELIIEFDYVTTGNALATRVKQTDGTVLREESAVDDTHSGGTFGFYSNGGTGEIFDDVTEVPL